MTSLSSSSGSADRVTSRLVVALVGALVVALTVTLALVAAPRAEGADMSRFDPGLLISDRVFWDPSAMSDVDIQGFLNTKGAACTPVDGPCLKSYRLTTTDRPADDRCRGAYAGGVHSAATIIHLVARACGVNPRVLLVTLQKEQSLVTRTRGATEETYRKAMGFGCPDTAECDARYYGFFNQVYSAAWRFRDYALNPAKFNHKVGQVNHIRYHPDVDCGTSPVVIRSQATAGLYNYTPYQPNAAALAAGYRTGDACSAYGNRNFWAYFTDWFGSTISPDPVGFLDSAAGVGGGAVRLSGWAIDPDTSGPVTIHVYVDGRPTGTLADRPRPDIGAAFPGVGDNHGFSIDVPVAEGRHTACAYAINQPVGPNPLLGCRTVDVRNTGPVGSVDMVTATPSSVQLQGWTWDPDTTGPVDVHVYIDGRALGRLTASGSRPDVAAGVPGAGPSRGFSGEFPAAAGAHQVCVYAINVPTSVNPQLGCRTVTVVNATPVGFVDRVAGTGSTIQVGGWAFDADAGGPIGVHVYVDGAFAAAVPASAPRPDVAAAHRAAGPSSGYGVEVPAARGPHQVCVYAINGPAGVNPLLGCRSVTVA